MVFMGKNTIIGVIWPSVGIDELIIVIISKKKEQKQICLVMQILVRRKRK